MKVFFKIFIVFLACSVNCFANISDIESKYSEKMKGAKTDYEMRIYTIEATEKLKKHTDTIYQSLINTFNSKQINILEKNYSLWEKYTQDFNSSTIKILYKQKGSIYQDFARMQVYNQALSRAIILNYLQDNSEFINYDYNSKQLNECLINSKNESQKCECYNKEISLIKKNINININNISERLNQEEFIEIQRAQISLENYLNHTKKYLFKIINSQKNNSNKKIKKAQILYMIYQNRLSELLNLNFQ